jgi:hypothetical protein
MTAYSIEQEHVLARRLRELGAANWNIFAGTTTREVRRDRARIAITSAGLAECVTGMKVPDKKPETFAQFFQRIYSASLLDLPTTQEPKR